MNKLFISIIITLISFSSFAQEKNSNVRLNAATNNFTGVVQINGAAVLTNRTSYYYATNFPFVAQSLPNNTFGLPFTYMFKKLVVAGDSRSVSLTNDGWFSFGGALNSSIASATTNQPDGSIYYKSGSNPTNNISLWSVLTNIMAWQQGFNVELDTAMCVPGQQIANIIGGYAVGVGLSNIGVEQLAGNAALFQPDGKYTNTFGFYGGIGPVIFYTSNKVAQFSIMNTDTNITGLLYQGNSYTITNGLPIIIYPTNSYANRGYSPVVLIGTPNITVRPKEGYTYYAGIAGNFGNYFPPYSGNTATIGSNNVPESCWLITNAPTRTGKPTAVALMGLNNDCYFGVLNNNETNMFVILNAATNVFANIKLFFQTSTIYGYYPRIVVCEPNASGSSQAAAGPTYTLYTNVNNMIRNMGPDLVDIIVDLDTMALNRNLYSLSNPNGTNWLGGTTTAFGDGNHYSYNYCVEQGYQLWTNSFLSTLAPIPGWVPASSFAPLNGGLWNSNNSGAIYYVRPNIKTNYITGP